METQNVFIPLKRKYNEVMESYKKGDKSEDCQKAIEDLGSGINDAEKEMNYLLRTIVKDSSELKSRVSSLETQMTTITNTLNCREVVTVFNKIFMGKLRKKLGISKEKSESFGLYGLNDIEKFVDNENSVKWVKVEDNWRDRKPSSKSSSRRRNNTSTGRIERDSAFKQELMPAYRKIAKEMGFTETISELVDILTSVKKSLNEFVHGSNSIYNHNDTKEVVLKKYNTICSGNLFSFTRVVNALDRESNFYDE